MDYTTKLAYQSNYWYNDGLKRANIRDLTGAITSLKKSLQPIGNYFFRSIFRVDNPMKEKKRKIV